MSIKVFSLSAYVMHTKYSFFFTFFNVVVTRSLVQNKTRISPKHTFIYTLYLKNIFFLNLKNMGNEPLKPLSDTLQGVIKKNSTKKTYIILAQFLSRLFWCTSGRMRNYSARTKIQKT